MIYDLVILGGGESGVGTALLAKANGVSCFVSDMGKIKEKYKAEMLKLDIDFEEDEHSDDEILMAKTIVKSPGIPDTAAIVEAAREKGIPVISEIEYASNFTQGKTICITGTNGKTTTTEMVYKIFADADTNVGVAGNIGKSWARQLAKGDKKIWVLELSSFQIDGLVEFQPETVILTNISPDHLDRYNHSEEAYSDSKMNLVNLQNKNGNFIYCFDDEGIQKALQKHLPKAEEYPYGTTKQTQGGYIENKKIIIKTKNKEDFKMSIEQLAISGLHNTYNSMAAAIGARIYDIKDNSIRESLMNFQGVEHRLEYVATIKGVDYVNDSKATNVTAAWYGLESQDKPVVWIAGGVDKGNDYEFIKPIVEEKVRVLICMGLENHKLHAAFSSSVETIVNCTSADEAIHIANQLARKGEVVLLSPACASFDLFDNYEQRGNVFKNAVRNI